MQNMSRRMYFACALITARARVRACMQRAFAINRGCGATHYIKFINNPQNPRVDELCTLHYFHKCCCRPRGEALRAVLRFMRFSERSSRSHVIFREYISKCRSVFFFYIITSIFLILLQVIGGVKKKTVDQD